MTTTRRSLLALTAGSAALALTACSGDNASKESTSVGASPAGGKGKTRTVTDASGKKVKVPLNPKRIVVTHNGGAQPLYDLGIYPVGRGVDRPNLAPAKHQARLDKIPVVATVQEPEVEKIAQVKPDLILVPNVTKDDILTQLKRIAPVFVFTLRGGNRGDWTSRTREIGGAIGRADDVKKLDSAYRKRVKKIKTDYADVIKGKVVGIVGVFEDNNLYAWGSKNMTGDIVTSLGFDYSKQEDAAVKGEKIPEASVSFEKVGTTVGDADILFLDSDMRGKVSPLMKSLQKTSLYKKLKSVKAGRAYPIGKTTVAGYSDANYTLDQIEKALKKMRG